MLKQIKFFLGETNIFLSEGEKPYTDFFGAKCLYNVKQGQILLVVVVMKHLHFSLRWKNYFLALKAVIILPRLNTVSPLNIQVLTG